MIKIVILDAKTTNPGDISWSPIEAFGELEVFDYTEEHDLVERALDADIILTNKTKIDKSTLEKLPKLRCICLLATGYNNIEINTCKLLNIKVFNAKNYSSTSVAQHVFAGILNIIHRIDLHSDSVKKGQWSDQPHFSYQITDLTELSGKYLGIYGFGKIGQTVGKLGLAFGMKIIASHTHPKRDQTNWVKFVSEDELLRQSDVLTLHAPLSPNNFHFINKTRLSQMKLTSILINTGRGGLINEAELANALRNNVIHAAFLDVMNEEPPQKNHELYTLDNCFITPHQGWASRESRMRLVNIVAENINNYLKGDFGFSIC